MGALMHAGKNDRRNEEEEDAANLGQQYLTFLIGKEVFAIGIADIREIIEYREPTTVPMMPSFIRGVLNLRGRVVPVIDLLVRFGRESTEASRRTCIVILEVEHEGEQQYIGIVVDAVRAVLDIADADIEPPPSFGARLRSDFVSGMGKVHDEFVIILDTEHVLSIEELSMLAGLDENNQVLGSEQAMLPDDVTTGDDTE
ncbi:MAG: chemotaxis protein CheW [Gammaproteobacteria bacterium]|nr:chemotaxis protein CheW [Gammaproteobacteria bacterium]